MLTTFLLTVVGWIIFRAETIAQAWDYIVSMFVKFQICIPTYGLREIVYILILLSVEWLQRDKQHALQFNHCNGALKYRTIRWAVYMMLIVAILVLSGVQAEFIYFQF